MPDHEIKFRLEKLLGTLKRNQENVPIAELKTMYKKGYENLCKEIGNTSSLFVRQILFQDMKIRKDLLNEAIPIVDETIQKSGYLKKFSEAAFRHQDIAELESLAVSLGELILKDLKPFYARYISLMVTEECLENPILGPLIFNAASGCIWENGMWTTVNNLKPNNNMVT